VVRRYQKEHLGDPNFKLSTLDGKIRDFVRNAYVQTLDTISKHEWLKGKHTITPKEEVGYFVTFMRREACNFVNEKVPLIFGSSGSIRVFLSKLYDVDMWLNAGFPRNCWNFNCTHGSETWVMDRFPSNCWNFNCTHGSETWVMDNKKMEILCETARSISSADEIGSGLANLQRDLYPLQSNIDKMMQLNQESDQLITSLCITAEGR
jgi:hypothetical protein